MLFLVSPSKSIRLASVTLLFFAFTNSRIVSQIQEESLPWWKTALIYEAYPWTTQDSDGDGIGDLKGITQRAHYYKEIGVTALWLTPIFPSPRADYGYDISDYKNVDPIFGTIDDLKELMETLNSFGIKLLLDFVPNHTSDEHEWFQKSIKREDPYTDYYIWENGTVDPVTGLRVPPNNWITDFVTATSKEPFGAWHWNEERQQFFFHQFFNKQIDLNLRNPLVVAEMDDVIRFWMDFGIDGFRVDAVPFFIEDEQLRDNPLVDGQMIYQYTQNLPETYELMRHWADVVVEQSKKDGKERVLILEVYADLNQTMYYYDKGKRSLLQPLNFFLQTRGNQDIRPIKYRDIILNWTDKMPPGEFANWEIGNHDVIRAANLFGDQMVDAMNMLIGVLPGFMVTYYGEELGMQDTYVRWDQTVDPAGLRLGPDHYQESSRDPERSPFQWDDTNSAGFSTNSSTLVVVNPDYWTVNVAKQEKAHTSHLKVYKALTAARADPVLRMGNTSVLVPNDDTLVVVRRYQGRWFALIINMGSTTATYTTENLFAPNDLDDGAVVVVASINSGSIRSGHHLQKGNATISLRQKGAVLLRNQD